MCKIAQNLNYTIVTETNSLKIHVSAFVQDFKLDSGGLFFPPLLKAKGRRWPGNRTKHKTKHGRR